MSNYFGCVLFTFVFLVPTGSVAEGLVDTLVQRFTRSDFEFLRATSNAPFPPLAALTTTGYAESEIQSSDNANIDASFRQTSLSQYALVPIPLGRKDAAVIGEWVSWTRFDPRTSDHDDLDVLSVSVPVGWLRQPSENWQLAAFVAPLGHRTHEEGWYWETLGGVFARNVRSDRFAWIVGAYFDVSPLEDFYTPYVGATYIVNERWTLNAVMPWPSVTYAPSKETLLRFGVSPSGASWIAGRDGQQPLIDLSAWNVGFAFERRVFKNVWVGVEVGTSCLRGLSLVGGDWPSTETRLDRTGYGLISLNLRPSPGANQ